MSTKEAKQSELLYDTLDVIDRTLSVLLRVEARVTALEKKAKRR